MSDQHTNETRQLDLGAIEARAGEAWRVAPLADDVLALVAEVRRLRAKVERVERDSERYRQSYADLYAWHAICGRPGDVREAGA